MLLPRLGRAYLTAQIQKGRAFLHCGDRTCLQRLVDYCVPALLASTNNTTQCEPSVSCSGYRLASAAPPCYDARRSKDLGGDPFTCVVAPRREASPSTARPATRRPLKQMRK